jgi:hypothetical protein
VEVNIFLLPLLGGYIFIKKSTWFRFRSIRYNAQELILSSAVAGLIGVTFAFLITTLISNQFPGLDNWWKQYVEFNYLGTTLCAFITLVLAGYLPNRWIEEENQIKKIIREDNDGIELILLSPEISPRNSVECKAKGRLRSETYHPYVERVI